MLLEGLKSFARGFAKALAFVVVVAAVTYLVLRLVMAFFG